MISPRERYEREEFWELADEIGMMTDIPTNNRTFFQRFFRKNEEWTGKE